MLRGQDTEEHITCTVYTELWKRIELLIEHPFPFIKSFADFQNLKPYETKCDLKIPYIILKLSVWNYLTIS